jgi:hypothetical protein
MSLQDLTDNIVQLCEECNVWSSTINIPHGNGDILDISAACGSQACTPKGAAMYPETWHPDHHTLWSKVGFSFNLQVCISNRNRLVLTDEDPSEYSLMENLIISKNHFKKSNFILCTFHSIWMEFKQPIVKTYGDQEVAILCGESWKHTNRNIPFYGLHVV